MNSENYISIINNALEEDIKTGDLTSQSIFTPADICTAQLIAKQDGIIAGLAVFKKTFELVDKNIRIILHYQDGQSCHNQAVVAEISGTVLAVLSAERVALNLLQRMSGIATLTNQFVKLCANRCQVLDTRKTAPNLRVLDKWAVKLGGGVNHRIGLYDMALIKENHIKAAGGISHAVNKVIAHDHHNHPIEVEVTDLDELAQALLCDIDRIMLDNMDNETMREAVAMTAKKIDLEASGNVSLDSIEEISKTGVDYISIGALTHSVRAMDFSLLIK
ncbi:MAG: carboxylating nicotinate-nucleotide diphosphorylase [Alcanivoracaceae bacterium]|nr:carboxylating nicotinate-nucleotide diphosphorylase [Alcanivoracaceae bacterium]